MLERLKDVIHNTFFEVFITSCEECSEHLWVGIYSTFSKSIQSITWIIFIVILKKCLEHLLQDVQNAFKRMFIMLFIEYSECLLVRVHITFWIFGAPNSKFGDRLEASHNPHLWRNNFNIQLYELYIGAAPR
jgi:hypothetical protein